MERPESLLVAKEAVELTEMMRNMEAYLDEKPLVLNVEKSKVMEFGKGTGRRRKLKWKWKGMNIEAVNEFT